MDDGKSTLIGRLLYDSQSVYEDQVSSVEKASKNRNAGPIDFSLFTDGLRAEREQGITIDVAYRYFATARRKFILADTPGHEQYTRNMATGASTADVAILLVDARNGVRVQSKRHARIARLLGITDFVLAINKMDLVDFDRDVFEKIRDDFERVPDRRRGPRDPDERAATATTSSPAASARRSSTGRRCSSTSRRCRSTATCRRRRSASRCSSSLRPDHEFRGYAGQIASGIVRVGDRVTAWPSGRSARVKRIVTYDGDLDDGVRADVGDADAGRRDRHQPRRRADASSRRSSGSSSRPKSSGWTSGRSIRAACTC